MAVAGIGVDLLEIERLERALARRPRLADRLFTDRERAYAEARPRPAQHLAARFCAKEAVMKALGTPALGFREIEVVAGDPQPTVRLSGAAARRASELGAVPLVSLAHERSHAIATAVLAREPRE